MFDIALNLAQAGMMASLTAWMAVGLWDNWRNPDNNMGAIAAVLRLDGLREARPDIYPSFAGRRIAELRVARRIFRATVWWECLTVFLLGLGTLALLGSLFGLGEPATARGLSLIGVLCFTLLWAGFLAGGAYFGYWFMHPNTQITHLLLLLWGITTMIFLAMPL